MAIITAEQFRSKSTAVIKIPGFEPGEHFEIRVRRLSVVGLISSGKIPNSLMKVVKDAFAGIQSNTGKGNDVEIMDKAGEIGKLLDIVCTEAMLEPRFADVKDAMNDAQKLAVFQFTQGGVEEVKPFPAVTGDTGYTSDVEDVSTPTE